MARKRKRKPRRREEFTQGYRARSEARNEAARATLEPLGEGERPLVVTIGAVISALIALSGIVLYAVGVEVDGERPEIVQIIAPAALLATMAYGMARARYWAVLGFQTLLGLLLVFASLGLLQATTVVQALGNTVMIAGAGTLFWFMVKAMARIQMPSSGDGH